MYIPKCICPSVLLFYCSPRPTQKDFFPTKPFISSLQTGHNLRSQKQFTFF